MIEQIQINQVVLDSFHFGMMNWTVSNSMIKALEIVLLPKHGLNFGATFFFLTCLMCFLIFVMQLIYVEAFPWQLYLYFIYTNYAWVDSI